MPEQGEIMSDTVYYKNMPVSVISEIKGNRVLIEIEYEFDDEEGYCSLPIELVVQKSELRKHQVTFDDVMKAGRSKIQEERNIANRDLANERMQIGNEINDLKKQLAQYENLSNCLLFMKPEYKFIVTQKYDEYKIIPIDKALESDPDRYEPHFAAFAIRGSVRHPATSFLTRYANPSGDMNKCWFFKTIEDAKIFVIPKVEEQINKNTYYPRKESLKALGVTSPAIEAHLNKLEEQNRESNQKLIKQKEAELSRLKEKS